MYGVVSIPTDSVMVLCSCPSPGCCGYLHALLEAHTVALPSLRHPIEAHRLATSLMSILLSEVPLGTDCNFLVPKATVKQTLCLPASH